MKRLAAAAALLGAGTMVFEISLTRLFSVLLFYHYVFLVLSVALLGLGLGGVLAALLPERKARAGEYASGAAILAALTTVVVTTVSARWLPAGAPLLHGAVALVPFLCVGIALPLLLTARPRRSGGIYAADLAGAAGGAILVFALLYFSPITAAFGAALLFAIAAHLTRRPPNPGPAVLGGLIAVLLVVNAAAQAIEVDLGRLASGKPLALWLERGQASILRTDWDPFGRTDVVTRPDNAQERLVFIDGAAGSALPHFPSDANEETKRRTELGSFPYHLIPAERVLVIGSGGGIGVLYALLAGVGDVTAVEVSPGVVDAVRAEGEYDGYLYDRAEVDVVIDEGRSFLERDESRYDVIDLSLVVSLNAAQSGYALTENYLFTEEAFATAYDHLTETGLIAVRLYDDPTLTRAFLTAATALRRYEASDAAAVQHLTVIFNPLEADRGGPAFYPMLLISKRPLTPEAAVGLTARAENLGYTVMYAPFIKEEGPFGTVARGEASLPAVEESLTGGDFTPTTDARPFFFEMTGGLPRPLAQVWLALVVVVVAVGLGLIAMLRSASVNSTAVRPLGYFALLGVGFMVVELALLARLSLFLGHPTVALATILAGLLLAGGAGSFISHRIPTDRLPRAIPPAAVAAAMLSAVLTVATDAIPHALLTLPLAGRIAVAIIALAPFGLTMGMLFPSGLRLGAGDAALPWAINGVASVAGATLAMTLALEFGYPTVAYTGALLYGTVALAGPWLLGQSLPFLRRTGSEHPSALPGRFRWMRGR